MTDTFLALAPIYGLPFLAMITALSCLGLPAPASVVMMMMGSFAAAGDFPMLAVLVTALTAAICGDQLGFFIGRFAGKKVIDRLSTNPARKAALERATLEIDKRGRLGVFFTRWLLSPLGPYVNLITGAAGFPWSRFTLFGVLGEIVWVTLSVGLGVLFSDNVVAIAEIVGNASGFLAAGVVTLLLGWQLFKVLRPA
ncbi:MAG: DedA family protein [Allorhizobium sp.]